MTRQPILTATLAACALGLASAPLRAADAEGTLGATLYAPADSTLTTASTRVAPP